MVMEDMEDINKVLLTYKNAAVVQSLFRSNNDGTTPLTQVNSFYPVPHYPFCTLGILDAKDEWSSKKGIAFVIQDNYILTCASNCYSHQHGEYPNITFTINSNRTHGYETYKIEKVFIPEQYKILPQSQRKDFNYALLQIEAELSFKERYGSIGIQFNPHQARTLSYLQCINNDDIAIPSITEHRLSNVRVSMDGGPVLWNDKVVGLTFKNRNSESTFFIFNKDTLQQFEQWVKIPRRILDLKQVLINDSDLELLKDLQILPFDKIDLTKSYFKSNCIEQLPFSSVRTLNISLNKINQIQLTFLKLPKFQGLKQLILKHNLIGPQGCKCIVEASFADLRKLDVSNNKIGSEGCKQLSKGNWPFLKEIIIYDCVIKKSGLRALCRGKWPNLRHLNVSQQNKFNNKISPILQEANFPQINQLNLSKSSITYPGLFFLRSLHWKSLTQLRLSQCQVGRRGCMLIKQSGFALRTLRLNCCNIESVGIKWLCKADLRRIVSLDLSNNSIGDMGYYYLTRANLPQLEDINIYKTKYGIKAQYLLLVDWTGKALSGAHFSFWRERNLQLSQLFNYRTADNYT